jgi:hypothetical protein
LDRLNDLLTFLYDKTDDHAAIRRKLLPVLIGLSEAEIKRLTPDALASIEDGTREWNLRRFRAVVRQRVERLIEGAARGESQRLPHLRRTLMRTQWEDAWWFSISSRFVPRGTFAGLVDVVVLEAAEDLAGVRVDALVRCPMCKALTLRQRAKAKKYCSSACRWRAIGRERRRTLSRAARSNGD